MSVQIQLRRGNASQWSLINPLLAQGEIGIELDTNLFKIGDGVSNWNTLPYSKTVSGSFAISASIAQTSNLALLANTSSYLNGEGKVSSSLYFSGSVKTTWAEGQVWYDNVAHSLMVGQDANVSLNLGQEMLLYGRNQDPNAATLSNGKVVGFAGSTTGQTPNLKLAIANGLSDYSVVGVATEDITNNNFGYITTYGYVHDLNTLAWNEGDFLWLSTTSSGSLTNVAPTYPSGAFQVALVVYKHGTNGIIFVSPKRHFSDASITASYAISASWAPAVADLDDYVTSSWTGSNISQFSGTSSYAISASYAPGQLTAGNGIIISGSTINAIQTGSYPVGYIPYSDSTNSLTFNSNLAYNPGDGLIVNTGNFGTLGATSINAATGSFTKLNASSSQAISASYAKSASYAPIDATANYFWTGKDVFYKFEWNQTSTISTFAGDFLVGSNDGNVKYLYIFSGSTPQNTAITIDGLLDTIWDYSYPFVIYNVGSGSVILRNSSSAYDGTVTLLSGGDWISTPNTALFLMWNPNQKYWFEIARSNPSSASYAVSASYAANAGNGTSLTTGSSYPITASWSLNALSASYVKALNDLIIESKNNLDLLTSTANSVVLGEYAGKNAVLFETTLVGHHAAQEASSISDASVFGFKAALSASNLNNATVIGAYAAKDANEIADSVIIGVDAGLTASLSDEAVMIGASAGNNADNSNYSVMVGSLAGSNVSAADKSIMIGYSAGKDAQNATGSILIGANTGADTGVTDIRNSIVIGQNQVLPGPNTIIIGNSDITSTKIYGNINITGSIQGSSSYAISASYAPSAIDLDDYVTSSWTGSNTSRFNGTASFALSSSWATNVVNAPFVGGTMSTGSTYPITSSYSLTASYYNDIDDYVTSSWTGSKTSQFSGTSSFAISASWAPSTGGGTTLTTGSSYPITASWAVTSSYSLNSAGGYSRTPSDIILTATSSLSGSNDYQLYRGYVTGSVMLNFVSPKDGAQVDVWLIASQSAATVYVTNSVNAIPANTYLSSSVNAATGSNLNPFISLPINNKALVQFVYDNKSGTAGQWQLINCVFFAGVLVNAGFYINAIGNYTSSTSGSKNVLKFNGPATASVTGSGFVDVLIIAGGGGGALGGGGAGGLIYSSSYTLSAGTYPIVIGQGGAGVYAPAGGGVKGGQGGTSSFEKFIAYGGGGGGGIAGAQPGNGGSGGGAGFNSNGSETAGGTASYGTQGNNGGASNVVAYSYCAQGGGGGYGGPGQTAPTTIIGGNGGIGAYFDISGVSVGYAGGGGGVPYDNWANSVAGTASYGGGNGNTASFGGSGSFGTGGGGGGASENGASITGGPGGSGVLIIRY